jgi:hypothetical protein
MPAETWPLAGAALSLGIVHTLLGPDHYVPFVAMSQAGRWSTRKTLIITWLCGLGHVISSLLIGVLGIALGIAVQRLEGIESHRGELAAWLLIAFGSTYMVWGLVHARRGRTHSHVHVHADGTIHKHPHDHHGQHLHPHSGATGDVPVEGPVRMTPWILFTIFLFGPCEPLIPLLMYPAAKANAWGLVIVTALFSLATLATMTLMVVLLVGGCALAGFSALQRSVHAMAGCLVLACGVAMKLGF